MQFSKPTPAGGSGDDDHLIPLINIVFLMLIFFMIAGQILPSDSFEIRPPSSSVEQPAPPQEITVLMDEAGQLAINGDAVTLESLGSELKQLLAQEGGGLKPTPISLKVDADLSAAELSKVLDALREAKASKVMLYTIRKDS